jgi:23S rRNA (guanine1835-N2)-methyltransferase
MLTPQIEIKRYPLSNNDNLQGWDAADELILAHMQALDLTGKRILIVNDKFGALSCGLMDFACTTYTDSYVSMMGIRFNSKNKIEPVNDLGNLTGVYDYVLIQLPKNMSFFEDILCHLTYHLHPQSKIICGSMVKHMAPMSFELIQKYIGETTTSLAQKKARLIFSSFQKEKSTSPFPLKVKIDSFEKEFVNHSNLFSREKLDIGTRFFLEHIPQGNFTKILDLGCANGIVGIKAKMNNQNSQIIFSDESYMAIQSAQINYESFFKDQANYTWTNCFENQPTNYLDLVLCNPPFHQQNTIGDFIAWQMFQDAHSALRTGGLIRVIGNNHLNYQAKLKKLFGNSKSVATNNKFVICEAYKTSH